MALRKALIDPFTRSELVRFGLEELSRNLWPGRCLSCGGDLAEAVPAVLVVADVVSVTATLHHPDCQQARWTRHRPELLDRYCSSAASLTRVPFGDPARDPFLPTMLVNPSLEQVSLAADEEGRYRATTVASYRPLGLDVPDHGIPRSDSNEICSWLTEEELVVRCHRQYWRIDLDSTHPWSAEIRNRGEVVLGISTALHPLELTNPEPIKRVLRDGDLATIVAPLNMTEPPPQVTGPAAVAVESEFAAADEDNDLDWLPPTRYPGPSYDPATGQFESGTSMDGPTYWTLNTPGHGVENGLIAGPPDIGKTNSLRIVLVEATCAGKFHLGIADPLDRNGLVDIFERVSEICPARTRTETAGLLEAFVNVVNVRTEHAADFREPTPHHPGILLALDDGHEVLRDPAVAELAEIVATRGPAVSVGLVVATASVEMADFGDRPELVRALTACTTNRLAFGKGTFEQLTELCRQLHAEAGLT